MQIGQGILGLFVWLPNSSFHAKCFFLRLKNIGQFLLKCLNKCVIGLNQILVRFFSSYIWPVFVILAESSRRYNFFLMRSLWNFIKRLISSWNFGKIGNRCNTGITILVFIRMAWMSGDGQPIRLEIGTDALVLFFPIRLTGVFFSRVVFGLGTSLISSSVSTMTRLFLERVLELLASTCTFSLLQGRSTSTNSTSPSLSESELPLYSTTREEYLGMGFLVSAMTEWDCEIVGIWFARYWLLISSRVFGAWFEIGLSNSQLGVGRW